MRAIDTNVLVRLLVRDDLAQAKAADAFVQGGAWVSWVVLAETAWVLSSVYGLGRERVAAAYRLLLGQAVLSIQDAEGVERALTQFETSRAIGFADCLILEAARRAGHGPLGTFDAALAKLDGTQRL